MLDEVSNAMFLMCLEIMKGMLQGCLLIPRRTDVTLIVTAVGDLRAVIGLAHAVRLA
jgi:hypothetical protein